MSQYGIRLKTAELEFDEFVSLTGCLMHDTPLGQIVAIRSETDPKMIENFTESQKRIRNEWLNRDKLKREEEYVKSMDSLFSMF